MRNLLAGFAAAALSVVLFHQTGVLVLSALGIVPWQPWSLQPVGPLGVPAILNGVFWGGLWGIVFAALWPRIPGGALALKGAVFALLGPLLIGRWLVVPLIKGEATFAGLDGATMASQVAVQIVFGAGIGLIYGWLSPDTPPDGRG